MKVGVAGCGAVGTFYGAKLMQAGAETHFLLRSDYEAVRERGAHVQSAAGDFRVRPFCARRPEEIGVCDLVVIALKATANDAFRTLLPPLVGPRTAILTLQNGLGNEERLAELFPAEQIMGGLCFVCLNRIAPGEILHIAHGRVTLGEFRRPPSSRTYEIAALFQRGGVDCAVAESLERAHWEKLVWNIPFNGLGVASCAGLAALQGEAVRGRQGECLTTDRLLAAPEWEKLVRELMEETRQAAAAEGHALPEDIIEANLERTRSMGAYQPSTLIDFERGQSVELESLFFEPLRRARAAGVAAPRLEALCHVLKTLNPTENQNP